MQSCLAKSNMADEHIAQRNRENTGHSTGPRTIEGRRRSAFAPPAAGGAGLPGCAEDRAAATRRNGVSAPSLENQRHAWPVAEASS